MPRYPRPGSVPARPDRAGRNPGPIPLRPLTVGEILAAAGRSSAAHLLPLGRRRVAVSALSTAVTLGALAATGSLQTYADAGWVERPAGGGSTTIPAGIVLATLLGLLVSTIGGPVVAGMAAAYRRRAGPGPGRPRRRGRTARRSLAGAARRRRSSSACWSPVGLLVLVVPGVLAYLVLVLAAPVAVMERGVRRRVAAPERRSSPGVTAAGSWARSLSPLIVGCAGAVIVSSFAGAVVRPAGRGRPRCWSPRASRVAGGGAHRRLDRSGGRGAVHRRPDPHRTPGRRAARAAAADRPTDRAPGSGRPAQPTSVRQA